jgi:hypothetical protein
MGPLKMFVTRSALQIADEGILVQICCGRRGWGRTSSQFDAILGRAEEIILGDLGVRQAMKGMPKAML